MASEQGHVSPGSKGIMTFHPTVEEFQNFSRYIAYMESQGAHKAGLAKIVPPKGWKPRRSYDDIDGLVIPAPIQQVVTGQSGLFTQYNIQKKAMTVLEFRKLANSEKFCSPHYQDFEELERKYWKNVTFNAPIYGADVNGSLYDPDVKEWNICRLNTVLDTVEHESGITIEGVNTPYLYFGMWKTTFAWHTEDMDLYSINYLHFGQPKSWYCVSPEHGKRMERLAHGFFPGSAQNCEAFLRHKMTLISPSILKKYGIPFEKMTQQAGEFMVTFPYAYHAGFNHGYNCAESTNFATQRWIEYGKQAILCTCRKDMVKISMDVFVKKFQPERYERWLAGRDNAPIDHSRPTPEAREFLGEGFDDVISSQECCAEEGERKSPTQRIETKRHRVCLELPDNVIPQEEEEEDEEDQYGKRPRLSLLPPRYASPDCKRHKGPPRLVVTPTKLTLIDPFRRDAARPPHYTKTRAPAISSQAGHHKGYLDSASEAAAAAPQPPHRKMGVASLLFHKTLSTKDALQVHGCSLEQQPPPRPPLPSQPAHMQIQVHSYAKEHKPRHLQGKVQTPGQSPPAEGRASRLEEVKEEPEEEPEVEPRVQVLEVEQTREVQPEVQPEESTSREEMRGPEDEDCKLSKRKGSDESYCKTVATKQQRQHQQQRKEVLHTLPRHHPLLREIPLDEDLSVEDEFEREEKDEWARPLSQLWQSGPYNLEVEREYNRRMGRQAPYCSICLLFHTHHQLESNGEDLALAPGSRRKGRQWSKPIIPEVCFNTNSSKSNESQPQGQLSNPHISLDGASRLVTCSQCCVRVHASCYGVSEEEIELDHWLCARCEAGATTEDCCLCSLRGGALQRANNNKWVHVLCAITVLEARFVSLTARRPIDLSAIPLARFNLKCAYCRKRLVREVSGCCVQCSHGRCSTAFHPTCAQAAGVLMYPDDWPFIVYITCHRHRSPVLPERSKASMRELALGQRVICKYRNTRYYHSEVTELTSATFYEVVFDDGSYSDNLFPEDIQNRDCVRFGPPSQGDVVQVRWTDGLIYGAKFVASHSIPMYQVEFEDGSQISVKREDIYTLDEDLPKRVKSRLSVASDMRFKIFTEKEVKQTSKRQRVINSRYREDYIEPMVYRAIME
ncbi:lysine-specific demethylase 4A-like isoform X1 [Gadus macrocephalus]|uniref:lysine-specific demethylase 4A-like isoform X1 n=1 Tax=Gadus macrocephalus TaxID=80720 RepID=UPI0028CB6E6B|nr:lysine-specific demethylase 4A-like isoform X1 [Gadus macrocephalus]